ncbi:hypothetical protein M758_7G141800 [Ceratodon purpureus]|nr:hypothetical protein M758_7G141800 [Ceratodon purpureus]
MLQDEWCAKLMQRTTKECTHLRKHLLLVYFHVTNGGVNIISMTNDAISVGIAIVGVDLLPPHRIDRHHCRFQSFHTGKRLRMASSMSSPDCFHKTFGLTSERSLVLPSTHLDPGSGFAS